VIKLRKKNALKQFIQVVANEFATVNKQRDTDHNKDDSGWFVRE